MIYAFIDARARENKTETLNAIHAFNENDSKKNGFEWIRVEITEESQLLEILREQNFIKIEISRSYLKYPDRAEPWETIWTTETGCNENINERIKELWKEFKS